MRVGLLVHECASDAGVLKCAGVRVLQVSSATAVKAVAAE